MSAAPGSDPEGRGTVSTVVLSEGLLAASTRWRLAPRSSIIGFLVVAGSMAGLLFWARQQPAPVRFAAFVGPTTLWLLFEAGMMARAFFDIMAYYRCVERGEAAPKHRFVRAVYSGQFPSVERFDTVQQAITAVRNASNETRSHGLGVLTLILALVGVCVVALIITQALHSVLSYRTYSAVSDPLMLVFIMAFFGATALWRSFHVRRIRAHLRAEVKLVCTRCGYDLEGLSDPRCPECGWVREFVPDPPDRSARIMEGEQGGADGRPTARDRHPSGGHQL